MPCSHAQLVRAVAECRSVEDAVALAVDGSLGLSYEALLSICSQRLVAETKATMGRHRSADTAARYVRRFLNGETLCSIARDVGLPPTMLSRVVLEEHLGIRKGVKGKAGVGVLIKNPSAIEDPRLRSEVMAAIAADVVYGPTVDVSRRIVGLEYELVLQQELRARRIPFLSEDELRLRAAAKTPDALLPVPILVRGRQVHWIDSKATFGDPASHAEYVATQFSSYVNSSAYTHTTPAECVATQFSSYVNRYASGLVIYWFGFDASIDTDADLLLLEAFPHGDCELMSHCALHDAAG